MLLFLDIDGVLHPYFTLEAETDPGKAKFCHLPMVASCAPRVP
jgi:hypothetical protein